MSEIVRRNQVEYNVSEEFLSSLREKANSDGILEQEEIEILRQFASEEELRFLNSFSDSSNAQIGFTIVHESNPSVFQFNLETINSQSESSSEQAFQQITSMIQHMIENDGNISSSDLRVILDTIKQLPSDTDPFQLTELANQITSNIDRTNQTNVFQTNLMLQRFRENYPNNQPIQILTALLEYNPPEPETRQTDLEMTRLEQLIVDRLDDNRSFRRLVRKSDFSMQDIRLLVQEMRQNENVEEEDVLQFVRSLTSTINSNFDLFKNTIIDAAVQYDVAFNENSRPSRERSIRYNPFARSRHVRREERRYERWLDDNVRMREDVFRQVHLGLNASIGSRNTNGRSETNTESNSHSNTDAGNTNVENTGEVIGNALTTFTNATLGIGVGAEFDWDRSRSYVEIPRRVALQVMEAIEEGRLEDARTIMEMFLPQINPEQSN